MACDLNFSEDQRQIFDAATAMLNSNYPLSRLHEAKRDDLSAIAEFGAFDPASHDEPDGLGLVEEALIHVLFGRHLISTRALALSIAGRLAAELVRTDLAEQAAHGSLGVCAAVRSNDSLLLIDAEDAEVALVFDHRRLALVDLKGQSGNRVTGLGHGVPLTRFGERASAVLGECRAGRLLDIADLLVSAQLLGIAEATRDLAVSYAQVRQQFGRPIGSFQAIKHHCANMAIAAEALSSQLDIASIALRDGRGDAAFQVAALRLLAPKAALANARTCIQIHGGIGFSDEAEPHRFLKQAHVLSRLGSGAPLLDLPAPLAPHVSMKEGN